MISAGDFKNGVTVEIDGNIYQILEFQHVKPGKGAAFVRTKLKNIISESHRFVRRAEERNSSDPEKSRRNVSDDLSASVIVTGRSGAAAAQ